MWENCCHTCIIPVDSKSHLFNNNMGKLRFTLTYILFWFIIVFSCILAENFAFFSSDHMGGMNVSSLIMLSMLIMFMLVIYYLYERKHNKVSIDKVLLPIIAIFGLVCIITILWQGDRTFTNPETLQETSIKFSANEKLCYVLQVIVWCGVLYGLLFVNNRYAISRNWTRWLSFIYIAGIFICSIVDIFLEHGRIASLFNDKEDLPLQFIIYNSNVWGHLLLVALLSCVVMNIKKFNPIYYILMFFFQTMIVFTSCATATFVGCAVLVLYSLYEILALINHQRKKSMILLVIFISAVVAFAVIFTVLVINKVPVVSDFWDFVRDRIIHKDYGTLTSRTGIWTSIMNLLGENPRDVIFGLGYKTGNAIFTKYYEIVDGGFAARSAHNGFFEIFLRHGIVGLLFYVAGLSVFVVGFIKLWKKHQYRIACLYSLCFVGLLVHSVAESTMFFTPNTGGTYATFIFFLPVANASKEKYFEELKKDLEENKQEPMVFFHKDVFYFVCLASIGLMIATASLLLTPYGILHFPVVLSIALFFAVSSMTSMQLGKKTSTSYFTPIRYHFIPMIIVLAFGLLFGVTWRFILTLDLFTAILFVIFLFVIYNLALAIFDKNQKLEFIKYCDYKFGQLLKKVSCEDSK